MKKILILAASLTLVAGLVGCGKEAPKETFVKSFQDVQKAETFVANTNFKVKLDDKNNLLGDPAIVEAINSAKLSTNIIADINKKQYEFGVKASGKYGPMNVSFEIPVFLDEVKQKAYVKTDDFAQFFSVFPVARASFEGVLEEVKGKYLEVDASQESEQISVEQQKKLESLVQNKVTEFVTQLPEENFVKNDKDEIEATIPGNQAKDLVFSIVVDAVKLLGEEIPQEEVANVKKELDKVVKIGDIKIVSSLHNKDNQKESVVVPLTIDVEGQTLGLELKIDTIYQSINEPVKFNFNLTKENILPQKEFEKILETKQQEIMFETYPAEEAFVEAETAF